MDTNNIIYNSLKSTYLLKLTEWLHMGEEFVQDVEGCAVLPQVVEDGGLVVEDNGVVHVFQTLCTVQANVCLKQEHVFSYPFTQLNKMCCIDQRCVKRINEE